MEIETVVKDRYCDTLILSVLTIIVYVVEQP